MIRSLILASFCLACAQAVAQPAPPPSITITGTASRDIEPDRAMLTVGVTSEKPSSADAIADNARQAQAIVAEVKAAGIEPRDIRTSTLTLFPVYASNSNPPKIAAYRASNQVTVSVRTLDKVGPLVQRLADKGITDLSGLAFDASNADVVTDDLRGEAAKDAKRKAGLYASALGVTLGRVLEVRADSAPPAPVFRMKAVAASPMGAPPVEAGTQRVTSDVTVTFELMP